MLLQELLRLGARSADPGEFTARAYFNGRIDLAEAEGVAATIAANSEQELAAARQLLSGELARRLVPLMDLVADTLALLEVGIDFSEEDVTFLSGDDIRARVTGVDESLEKLLNESSRFERLAHEPQVVLVGRPNAGKSTLLNALSGRSRAVVSSIAGTTRDVLSAEVMLHRGTVHVVDVAGIEDVDTNVSSTSAIDQQMRLHALRALEAADVVVLVHDSTDLRPPLVLPREPTLLVRSKADLLDEAIPYFPSPGTPGEGQGEGLPRGQPLSNEHPGSLNPHPNPLPAYRERGQEQIFISAQTGAGLDELKHRLDAICFGPSAAGSSLALNLRHVQSINEARTALKRVADQLPPGRIELLALDLREALDSLGGVLGRMTPDDLLGRIFAGFCIGK
jgi:tRNA modification GTPase